MYLCRYNKSTYLIIMTEHTIISSLAKYVHRSNKEQRRHEQIQNTNKKLKDTHIIRRHYGTKSARERENE